MKTRLPALSGILFAALVLGACAAYQPQPLLPDADLQGMQTATIGDVTVSVAILTDDQAEQHFGVAFARRGLQALWIRVRNEPTGSSGSFAIPWIRTSIRPMRRPSC